ncbi:TIGR02270 family protein [Pyxidicoccus parkwayensis]|uniref:TIGR02270 family protein n=1 Tax=Pyxidicoccus parkwayensis TaxID=2813578 RepID=A0ABX7NQC7_9BACT|nr:TIGR02270 family protein [Pyxidicoccus parkwaysis]QSQ19780.1 TIGR02270 family protein [Pyxidicoccus parkwaysis]
MDTLAQPFFELERRPEDVLWDVVERHLEEAAFFWGQWARHLFTSDFTLTALEERLESRLLAHLQGLVVGGAPVAERLLLPLLDLEEDAVEEEPLRVSAGARALLDGWSEPAASAVFESFARAGPRLRSALQRALELSERPDVARRLGPLLVDGGPEVQSAVLEVLAFREEEPQASLDAFLLGDEPRVALAALHLLEALPQLPFKAEVLRKLLTHPTLRESAIAVGLLRGHREAWTQCSQLVAAREPCERSLYVWTSLLGGREDLRKLLECLGTPRLRGDVLWALGFSGRVEAVDACAELLGDKRQGRIAAEALCAITGLELEEQFTREPSDDGPEEPVPLEEDELDADLSLSPEASLPEPDPEAVREWWRTQRSRFDVRTRYLGGKPLSGEVLLGALETAPMRRRHVLARQLALGSRGAFRLNTLASTRRQRRQLTRLKELVAASGRATDSWKPEPWRHHDD